MNRPVPTPPKNRPASKVQKRERREKLVNDLKDKSEKNKKLITFICTLKGGKKVEIRATEKLEVGKLCFDKHKEWPIDVEKKPFKMPEHLTQRLGNHEGLKQLQKSLNKNNKAGRN